MSRRPVKHAKRRRSRIGFVALMAVTALVVPMTTAASAAFAADDIPAVEVTDADVTGAPELLPDITLVPLVDDVAVPEVIPIPEADTPAPDPAPAPEPAPQRATEPDTQAPELTESDALPQSEPVTARTMTVQTQPTVQYMTVLWKVVDTDNNGDDWEQNLVGNVVTSTPSLNALDELMTQTECTRYQADVYLYTLASDKEKVDALIAGGILNGSSNPVEEPLIAGGAGTAWKVVGTNGTCEEPESVVATVTGQCSLVEGVPTYTFSISWTGSNDTEYNIYDPADSDTPVETGALLDESGTIPDFWVTTSSQIAYAIGDGDKQMVTATACAQEPFLESSHVLQCGQVDISLRNVSAWIYPMSVEVDGVHSYGPVVDNRTNGGLSGPIMDQTKTRTITFAEDSGTHAVRYRVQAGTESDLYRNLPVGTWTELTVETDCEPNYNPGSPSVSVKQTCGEVELTFTHDVELGENEYADPAKFSYTDAEGAKHDVFVAPNAEPVVVTVSFLEDSGAKSVTYWEPRGDRDGTTLTVETDCAEQPKPFTEKKATSSSATDCVTTTVVTQNWKRDWTVVNDTLTPGVWVVDGEPTSVSHDATATEIAAVDGLVCTTAPPAAGTDWADHAGLTSQPWTVTWIAFGIALMVLVGAGMSSLLPRLRRRGALQ